MTTIRESISRIRNVFKLVTEDAFLTDRFIYSLLLKHSKALIKRQDVENKLMQYDSLFETLPYVELIEVDRIEADCARIKTGCKIMRTKNKLPKLMTGGNGPILRTISPIDGSDVFQQCLAAVYVAMTQSTNFKYNRTHYFWYKNGYLYFPDIIWDAVSVEGMFEEAVDNFCNENGSDCTMAQDRNFTIPDYLFTEVEQMTEQEIMTLAKVPSDTGDNSQNILR
jgi:hypothetical protein